MCSPTPVAPAFSLFAISLYVMYSVKFLKKASPQWLSRLPLGIIVLAVILGLLQPEFGFEVIMIGFEYGMNFWGENCTTVELFYYGHFATLICVHIQEVSSV